MGRLQSRFSSATLDVHFGIFENRFQGSVSPSRALSIEPGVKTGTIAEMQALAERGSTHRFGASLAEVESHTLGQTNLVVADVEKLRELIPQGMERIA